MRMEISKHFFRERNGRTNGIPVRKQARALVECPIKNSIDEEN